MRKVSLGLTSLLVSLAAGMAQAGPVHTWHKIRAFDGQWVGRLVITSANEPAYFTDANGNKVGDTYDFKIKQNVMKPFKYGFGFADTADFNVSYVLTLYKVKKLSNGGLGFSSAACQYDISANGPANPDIRVESYHGAKCKFGLKPIIHFGIR